MTLHRPAIFFASETEKKTTEEMIEMVNESCRCPDPVVTTLEPFTRFWAAKTIINYLQKHPGG